MATTTSTSNGSPRAWSASAPGSSHGGEDYPRLIGSVRRFLDRLVGAKPTVEDLRRLADDLERWGEVLDRTQVAEEDQVYFRRNDLPDRGQCFSPVFLVAEDTPERISGTVTFGPYYLGGGGAVHGGAISLLFDQSMGSFSNGHDRLPSRTAYLNVSFHALTPVDEPLAVSIRVDREEGRKRFLVGELVREGVVCARAEALFVALRDDQL